MQSKTVRFRTKQRLESFIKDNFSNKDKFLVQIFLPSSKLGTIDKITSSIKSLLPTSNIVGCESKKVLSNSTVSDDIIINFIQTDTTIKYFTNYIDAQKVIHSDNLYLIYASHIDKQNFASNIDINTNLIGSFYNNFLLYNKEIKDEGIVVVKFEEEFDIDIQVADEVESIGRELPITKFKKNSIITIDNFSVQKLYEHYLTKELSKDIKTASYTFPLVINNKACIIQKTDDECIELDIKLKKNTNIANIGFANSSKFYSSFLKAIKNLDGKKSDLLFILSSNAREKFFKENPFEYDSAIGIFSDSELAVFNGKLYDLNLSILLLNLSSEDASVLKAKRYNKKDFKKENIEFDALSNIAKISSLELQTLNKELEKKVKKEVEKNLKKDSILIHRSRLAQMGEMISLIAHQWKQPLSAISATSSGLQVKAELDMYDKEFFITSLNKIESFVNHLSTTIDDFSNFFKPTKIKREFFISEAIDKALNIATYSLTKNSIIIELDIDKKLKVKSNKNELIQVLLNLIKNAENILVKREITNPKITIKSFKKEDAIYIQVIDNAGGVENSIKKKIFEPYFSTKATSDSTGIGLYMSRFIIENSLNGKLELKNEKSGANFSIILV